MENYHIVKSGDKWKFQKANSNRALKTAPTKAEAVSLMQAYMRNKVGSVKIHKQDGAIQEERTYPGKKDPKSRKG